MPSPNPQRVCSQGDLPVTAFAGEPRLRASMAVEFCRTFPQLRVVGLDVFPRVLALAHSVVAQESMTDRIELRHQDVATLEDGTGSPWSGSRRPSSPEMPSRRPSHAWPRPWFPAAGS